MADFDVVLYGATGYTGRLIARALEASGASFALAGRDARRLAELSGALASRPSTLVADSRDARALAAMAARGRVLLTAAGPFRDVGARVLDAALDAGVHYGDISGEQSFLRRAFERDARAREAGLAVVPALGFDVVPSDLAATLAAEGMPEVERLDIGIAGGGGMSGGTRRSAAASAGEGAWFDDGRFRSGPPGRFVREFRFPAPLGVRTTVFIPWGDVVTAPRSTGARQVRTFFTFPRAQARALNWSWPFVDLASRLPWTKRRARARADAAPEGPTPEARAKARFTIVAEARAPDGAVARGIVQGRDPYGFTGASAAHAALLLARGIGKAGALTPSQAFDLRAMAAALGEHALAWSREGGA